MKIIYYLLFCLFFNLNASSQNNDIYVYDYEKIFNTDESSALFKSISSFKQFSEVLIVTTPSIGDFKDAKDYSEYLANMYYKSDLKNRRLIIITVSCSERKVGLFYSNKLSNLITDSISQQIIKENMIPYLKDEEPYLAIREAINSLKLIFEKKK